MPSSSFAKVVSGQRTKILPVLPHRMILRSYVSGLMTTASGAVAKMGFMHYAADHDSWLRLHGHKLPLHFGPVNCFCFSASVAADVLKEVRWNFGWMAGMQIVVVSVGDL